MKLCRFELKAEPGRPRTGMVFSGKIYETEGANAVGVYEAETVRPLCPIPQPPSVRIFRSDRQTGRTGEDTDADFYYINPTVLAGASQTLLFPSFSSMVTTLPCLAAVVVSGGFRVELDSADDLLLGLTIANVLVAEDVANAEEDAAVGAGRSHDVGAAVGPVLTTPDELEDFISDQEFGRRYQLTVLERVNGVERRRGNVSDLPWTVAQAVASASQSCPLREGDLLLLGPLVDTSDPIQLEPGDEVQLAVESLGVLTLRLSSEA